MVAVTTIGLLGTPLVAHAGGAALLRPRALGRSHDLSAVEKSHTSIDDCDDGDGVLVLVLSKALLVRQRSTELFSLLALEQEPRQVSIFE